MFISRTSSRITTYICYICCIFPFFVFKRIGNKHKFVCCVSREKKREMGNNLYTAEDYAGAINSYQRYSCYH